MDHPERLKNLSWTGELMTGWLGFFIVTLVIISPIFNIYLILRDSLVLSDYVEGFANVSLFIMAGVFLFTKKPYAIKFAKIFLITTLITNIIFSIVLHEFKSYLFVYFFIWIPYLYKSEQIRQVFGRLQEKNKGYQIWPIIAIIYAFLSPICGAVFSVVALHSISKNRKLKGLWLSVSALVTSILVALIFIVYVFFTGLNVPVEVDSSCSNYCYDTEAALYLVTFDIETESYLCQCQDTKSNVLREKYLTVNNIKLTETYLQLAENASLSFEEALSYSEQAEEFFNLAQAYNDQGLYKYAVDNCAEARNYYFNASQQYRKAKNAYTGAVIESPDKNLAMQNTYLTEVADAGVNMENSMFEACQHLETAADYYSQGYLENGDDTLERMNEKLLEYNNWVEVYNNGLEKANSKYLNSNIVYPGYFE